MCRDANRTSDDFILPQGWVLEEIQLSEDLTVTLSGEVEIIRTDNEDSFQGPLDKEFNIIQEVENE